MARLVLILSLLLTALPAAAQELPKMVAQVALQPLPEAETPDIEAFVRSQWKAYYNGTGPYAFYRDQIRVGRIDLNEDGRAELFVLIDSPAWLSDKGLPLVVATWTSRGWSPIAFALGDSDGVFVTAERVDNWATILTPSQILQRVGRAYQAIDRR